MYTEHTKIEAYGFEINDVTVSGCSNVGCDRDHDDLIWVGYGGLEGRWLTVDQVEELAGALFGAATVHRARHAAKVPA